MATLVIVVSLQVVLVGQYFQKASLVERVTLLVAAILLFAFIIGQSYILFATGFGLYILVSFWQLGRVRALKPVYKG